MARIMQPLKIVEDGIYLPSGSTKMLNSQLPPSSGSGSSSSCCSSSGGWCWWRIYFSLSCLNLVPDRSSDSGTCNPGPWLVGYGLWWWLVALGCWRRRWVMRGSWLVSAAVMSHGVGVCRASNVSYRGYSSRRTGMLRWQKQSQENELIPYTRACKRHRLAIPLKLKVNSSIRNQASWTTSYIAKSGSAAKKIKLILVVKQVFCNHFIINILLHIVAYYNW